LEYLRGRRVLAFSGIATPESFEKFLRDLGATLVARERYLDHYRFVDDDFTELFSLAQREGAECLVTTEKDAVRISERVACPLPIYLPAARDRDPARRGRLRGGSGTDLFPRRTRGSDGRVTLERGISPCGRFGARR